MIIKSSDYKYPTKEERAKIRENCQYIEPFGFEYQSEIKMIFQDNIAFDEVKRKVDLFYWDYCLLNKLGKLMESYILLNTSYQRQSTDQTENEEVINNYLFDYYIEIYYYYFFSARDLIAQIINVFYGLKIEEDNVKFHNLGHKLNNKTINIILSDFTKITKATSDFRNSFTHRYPSNYLDGRGELINRDGKVGYGFGNQTITEPKDFISNIVESHQAMANLVKLLKFEFVKE
ncbi:MAG: Cthe_2314 family HEPN domain-containing protein [Bacteroidales bacterium]